jgi:beta-carotene 3-hydroxylase
MTWYEKALLVLSMILFMECFAWATHKYVMHGWGWGWHRSHHEPHDHAFEKNDLYAVTFASAVIALFIAGTYWEPIWWVALGITSYGAIYAFVHDMLVHQRFGMRWVPRRGYLKRLHQAHRLHHAIKTKEDGLSFGFLLAPNPAKLKQRLKVRAAR